VYELVYNYEQMRAAEAVRAGVQTNATPVTKGLLQTLVSRVVRDWWVPVSQPCIEVVVEQPAMVRRGAVDSPPLLEINLAHVLEAYKIK